MSSTTTTTTTTTTATAAAAASRTIAAGDAIPRGPVTATLTFYTPPADGSAPYNFVEKQPEGVAQNNFGSERVPIEITDIRGSLESAFTLDKNAFLAVPATPETRASKADFSSDETIKATYYPEVEELLLKNLPGAHRIFLFDHTIRRADPAAHRAPVMRTHIDQTPESATERVHVHMGAEAEELLKGRYRLVNVWRPLNGPVESFPLAVADSQTVPDEALVPVEHRYPQRVGYTAGVKNVEGMRWYYWSGMTNDERLLLQCFDSESGSRVPHTAFEDPRSTADSKPRESIEVRALVFG